MPDNVGGQQSGPPKNGDTKGKKIGKPGDKKGGAGDKAGGFYEKHKYWIWGGGLLLLVVLYFFLSGSKGSTKDPTAQQQSAADMAAQSGVDPSTGYLWGSPADLAAQGGSSGTGINGPPGPIGAPGDAGKPGTPGKRGSRGKRGKPGKGGDTDFHKHRHHKTMNHRNIHSHINPGGPRIKAPVGHRHQAH